MNIAGLNHVTSLSLVHIAAALGLACAATLAAAPALAQGTPEQRQACSGDAQRLCGEFIPDVDRITACMVKNRLRLSAACKVYFVEPRKGKPKRSD